MSLPLKAEPASKAAEPSMEEILASIRKIIADDEPAAKPAAKAAPPPEPEPEAAPQGQDDIDAILAGFDSTEPADEPIEETASSADVLELTEDMAAPDGDFGEGAIDFVEPKMDVPQQPAPTPQPAARPVMETAFEPVAPPPPVESLLSSQANSAIASAFGSLNHTILSRNARTLDDLVQEMLRPMLKNWLDENLPTMVERLVRAEIERVSRAGR